MATSYPNTLEFSNISLQQDAGDAFAALPAHILITHVLSSRNLPDPSDLARLRAVSREMRDAVAATGRAVYELDSWKAIKLGDLSGLQLLHQRGDLIDSDFLYMMAAGEGQLEILKWLHENNFQWDKKTFPCGVAWAPRGASVVARERLPVGRGDVRERGGGRAPRGAAVVARERLPVGRADARARGAFQTYGGAVVGSRERRTRIQKTRLKTLASLSY
jgi:hypothetical protein